MTVVTMATSPKSCGRSSLASAMMYARLRKNWIPCAVTVTSPLEIVRCLRFASRCSVAKCFSEPPAAGDLAEGTAHVTSFFTALETSTAITTHLTRVNNQRFQLRYDGIHHSLNADRGRRISIVAALIEKLFQKGRNNSFL